ncbi:hypothetical protein TRIUR3_05693 [Triticum urartu]|uniref:Uncharacterized protein n=1 Tax=Triticum urartu TaxID=4572 RepID=M8A4E4_TRIUA|nr:hypothetical protein TRIUR3_05693 [Triticum urartu]
MATPTVDDDATSGSSSPNWILLDTATRCGKYRWESLASATAQPSTAKALVIAVGADSLGWVDLWWGIVVCNLADDDEGFTTRFVPLPGPTPGNEHRFAACCVWSLRDVVCVGDLLKFVEIHFHGDEDGDEEDDGVTLEGRRVDFG